MSLGFLQVEKAKLLEERMKAADAGLLEDDAAEN